MQRIDRVKKGRKKKKRRKSEEKKRDKIEENDGRTIDYLARYEHDSISITDVIGNE